ncbi:MAG: cellulase family glycosylhydrolase [Lentisphaeria bacterium]|nr:cellulase family glycosylhydrolase [Lentisphaeria bacterium]
MGKRRGGMERMEAVLWAAAVGLALCVGSCQSAPGPTPERGAPELAKGTVIFQTNFEGADALKDWPGATGHGPGYRSARSLFIERPAGSPPGSACARMRLPVEKMRGYLLHFSGMVKAENVTEKPKSWNGIKFMVPIVTESSKAWPQGSIGVGSFDWRRVVFPVRVPEDAVEVSIYLGLESVTGKVWFDDIKVTVRKPPFVATPRRAGGPVYKGHDLPRLRGAMVSPNVDEESLRVLGRDWNANLVRWQLVGWRPKGKTLDLTAYDAWLEGELKKLDAALPLCEKYGLMVVVDLHCGPRGSDESGRGLFNDAACQERFVEVWKGMARKYKDAKAVWGYDLLNEPSEGAVQEDLADWEELSERTAKAIRAIDADTAIIIEPPQGGNPYGIEKFRPVDVPNVIYSVHMYLPHAFTHQGVHGTWKNKWRYPGEIDGMMWDKAKLEAALKPVIDFQKTYHAHIYIGEFSAIRWAPDGSACRYLRDVIDIFEAHGWDWSYHAFREWSGWSVEHGSDPKDSNRAAQPTDRQKLLREWFAKDKKPAWYKAP